MKKALKRLIIATVLIFSALLFTVVSSAKTDISGFTLEIKESTVVYNGENVSPEITLKDAEGNVISSDNYELVYLRGENATIDLKNAGEIRVRADGIGEYEGSVSAILTVKKAQATGTPDIKKITEGGKTLLDAKLSVNDSFNVKGSIEWVDGQDTTVKYKQEYSWIFTPDDDNYEPLTGKAKVFTECKNHTYSSACDTNCNACGDNPRVPGDHQFAETKIIQPTKDAEGEKTLTCLECGFTKTEPIPKKKSVAWIIILVIAIISAVGIVLLALSYRKKKILEAKKAENKHKKRKKHWKKKK
jgi:hypothetical protein